MTVQRKVEIIFSLAAIVLIAVLIVKHIEQAVAVARAEESAKGKQAIIDANSKTILDRDRAWERQSAAFQAQIDSIRTVAQSRQALQPIVIGAGVAPVAAQQVSKAELPIQVQNALPDAPSTQKYTLLSDPQIQAIAKNAVQCQKDDADLAHCHADLVSTADSLSKSQSEVTDWKNAAHGGTALHRTWRAAEMIGCAAGGAYLGNIHQHSGGVNRGSVIGAGLGVTACTIFLR